VSQPAVIAPRGGEVIGDAPERRVEILTDQGAMHATWSRFAPGRDGAGRHIHRRHHDVFYVLAGELTLKLEDDAEATAPAGTLVRVPPLVVHGFRNGGDAELRYLNFHAPGTGFADYMRGLRDGRRTPFDQEDPPSEGVRPASDAVVGGEEVVLDRPDVRVALLADIDEVGISETRADPGGDPVRTHVHRRHAESFYVFEGKLRATVEGRELSVGPGAWLTIPPGVRHGLALAGPEPVRFLNLHAPSCGFGAFIRALPATGGDPEEAAARTPFDEEDV
jgi:mannose-6-phosphate isomerase-like protein (cupin superfamily)